MTATLMDAALGYAAQGWPVFPVEPKGKAPIGRLVPHGLKDATTDDMTIHGWWAAEPDANIGTPTGVIFDAVDLDSEDAIKRFKVVAGEHNLDLTAFPWSRTGRGRHLMVSPTGAGNKVNVLPGVDWRGKGGYVLLPVSVHVTGQTYTWMRKPTAEGFPDAPEWLLELLRPAAPAPPPGVAPTGATPPALYLQRAIEGELQELRKAGPGTRNDTLNRAAFAMGTMVGANWISRTRAEAELWAAALATGLVDDGERGVKATMKSGLDAGILKPRPDVVAAASPVMETPHGGATPSIYIAADLETEILTRPRAIIPGIIQVGLTMLAGKGKLGKSWLALDVALAVAGDGRALESIEVAVAGDVLYLALEDNKWRMQERMRLLKNRHGFAKRLHISHQWPKLDEGGIQAIEGWLDDHPDAAMVIIDVWKRLRHSRQKGAQLYDEDYEHLVPLQAIALRHDVAVLVVHHTRKSAAEDAFDEISGTGGILAALDACVILHRTRSEADGEVWITGRDIEEAHLAMRFEGGSWVLLGSANETLKSNERREVIEALDAVTGGMTPAEVAEALGKPRVPTKQLMWKMFMDHEVVRVGGKYMAATRPITEPPAHGKKGFPVNDQIQTGKSFTGSFTGSEGSSPVNDGKRKTPPLEVSVYQSEYEISEPEGIVPLSHLPFTGVEVERGSVNGKRRESARARTHEAGWEAPPAGARVETCHLHGGPYWERADGGWVCSQCHPPLAVRA